MPATVKHIKTNIERIQALEDAAQLKELAQPLFEAQTAEDQSLVAAWNDFVKAADAQKVAHLIPGTVGRTYAKEYGLVKPREPKAKLSEAVEIKLTDAQLKVLEAYPLAKSNAEVVDVNGTQFLFVKNVAGARRALLKSSAKADEAEDRQLAAREKRSIEALLNKLPV